MSDNTRRYDLIEQIGVVNSSVLHAISERDHHLLPELLERQRQLGLELHHCSSDHFSEDQWKQMIGEGINALYWLPLCKEFIWRA